MGMLKSSGSEIALEQSVDEGKSITPPAAIDELQGHRTIDRVTQILEAVVYNPGMTFGELVRTVGAAKSSVHGFVRGLLTTGWLHEDSGRYYLGAAVYGLTLASGYIRAGVVTHADLVALHREAGVAVFVGVQAGDHLIYVAEHGSDPVSGFDAKTNIRRNLLATSGGKALLAMQPEAERDVYLRRHKGLEPQLVSNFLDEFDTIRRTRLATNVRRNGSRFAIATAFRAGSSTAVASITLVGPTEELQPRKQALGDLLLERVGEFELRNQGRRDKIN
ncbi:IclR family transcriptional regulator [Rhizobium sp. CF142]|uniref:IclR family transcriptional regulator n=1 Tax=Rhizobium sp. CF142 TaxID=1144314 RepID=UPI00026EFEE9|nr:helix-turn-helix domain-containing protein [Rhizobium sp. CF142]EJJ29277.1 transcriptional regulator [Rhizobium sp. CF142]